MYINIHKCMYTYVCSCNVYVYIMYICIYNTHTHIQQLHIFLCTYIIYTLPLLCMKILHIQINIALSKLFCLSLSSASAFCLSQGTALPTHYARLKPTRVKIFIGL